MRKTYKSVVIVPHDLRCAYRNKPDNYHWRWSGLVDGNFWGNFKANENAKHCSHLWVKVLCNDPDCKGIKAVHSSVLSMA